MQFFNRVKHQTPESVELEFTLAGIGSRAWALLIDYHVLALILVVFLSVWFVIATQIVEIWAGIFGTNYIELWLLAIALLVVFSIYTGYFVGFETLWQGQTPGKRIAKIRVIRDDGRPIGLQQATLRALLRTVDDTFFLGVFLIVFSRREKRLGDWVAGTIVIQAETSVAVAELAVSQEAQSLAEQLTYTADLARLLPDDFAVIREYLHRRGAMASQPRAQLSLELARQAKSIIALEQLPTRVTPDVFLEAVYLLYQQK